VFIKIHEKQYYLWRAVAQDGEVGNVFLQKRSDGKAAKRLFKRLLRRHRGESRKIVTDKLRSYYVAHREPIPRVLTIQPSTRTIELNSSMSEPE
jgi:putative transposase